MYWANFFNLFQRVVLEITFNYCKNSKQIDQCSFKVFVNLENNTRDIRKKPTILTYSQIQVILSDVNYAFLDPLCR